MIRVNFTQQLLEKSAEQGRHITIDDVAKESGISRITLMRIKKDPTRGTNTDIIDKLCTYFNCSPGDLLIHEIG